MLGVGIGVIATAFLGILFFMGVTPTLSDAEIRERALAIGMVDRTETELADGMVREADGTVLLTVQDSSEWDGLPERLFDAGVITSAMEFRIRVRKTSPAFELKPGLYRFVSGASTEAVADAVAAGPAQ